jgi:hypothetical protein
MNQDNGGVIGKINTPTTSLASGVWSLDSQFDSQSSSIWPLAFPQTTFANSARWNRADSPYLSKTFSSAGNRDKWTFSCWVKKCKTGVEQRLLTTSDNSSFDDNIRFNSDDTFNVICNNATVLTTNRVFRDTSAFYYISVVWDSGNSTSGDRCKLFVNGVRETSFSTESYPSQNQDSYINNNTAHYIGVTNATANSNHLDGYLTEVIFVDDQALDATSFGAFNPITNIWEPIAYAGTYGTNGFRFDFANSAELGTDVSGNSNTFSETNLATTDQSTDTCSNNFATLNPLASGVAIGGSAGTFTEGNLFFSGASSAWCATKGTFSVTQGKWYMEAKKTTNANGTSNGQGAVAVGFAELQSNLGNDNPQNDSDVYSSILVINDNGWTTNFANGTQWSTPLAVDDGDIVGIALDLDGNNYTFYVNGSQVDTGSLGGSYDGNGLTPCVINYGGDTREFTCNFGSPSFSISSGNADANGHGSFEYSVPSGYFSLCTKNLAEFGG